MHHVFIVVIFVVMREHGAIKTRIERVEQWTVHFHHLEITFWTYLCGDLLLD